MGFKRKGKTLAVASIYRDTDSLEAEVAMERLFHSPAHALAFRLDLVRHRLGMSRFAELARLLEIENFGRDCGRGASADRRCHCALVRSGFEHLAVRTA